MLQLVKKYLSQFPRQQIHRKSTIISILLRRIQFKRISYIKSNKSTPEIIKIIYYCNNKTTCIKDLQNYIPKIFQQEVSEHCSHLTASTFVLFYEFLIQPLQTYADSVCTKKLPQTFVFHGCWHRNIIDEKPWLKLTC